EAGGVADQREALAADPPGPAAANRVGVTAKRREGEVVGQPPAGGESRQQALEPPADGLAAQRAHADVQEVALREVPAVAPEVGLGDELGPAVARRERAQARGPARASRQATVLPAGPPPTTRTSETVIRAAALPARRAGCRAARAGARSRSRRAWPRRCRPRCRPRRRCMPRRSGARWAGGRCAGTHRASGTRGRSRSR